MNGKKMFKDTEINDRNGGIFLEREIRYIYKENIWRKKYR